MWGLPEGLTVKRFLSELSHRISEDNVSNGAAALAFYLTLSIFPALIFLLSLVPFLPIADVDQAILDLLRQAMPADAANMLTGVVEEIAVGRKGGLLSFGFLATLWAASTGMYAVMQQLNITYGVKEARSFVKGRLTALGLTLLFGTLVIIAFALVVLGGWIESWLGERLGMSGALTTTFAVLRWVIILAALLLAFALAYHWGPNVEQSFRFITPGSALGTLLLLAASLGFRAYVTNFGNYAATYGSIGAVIVLMLWLYITGLVLLVGSEINVLVEHHSPRGKERGEREYAAAS